MATYKHPRPKPRTPAPDVDPRVAVAANTIRIDVLNDGLRWVDVPRLEQHHYVQVAMHIRAALYLADGNMHVAAKLLADSPAHGLCPYDGHLLAAQWWRIRIRSYRKVIANV